MITPTVFNLTINEQALKVIKHILNGYQYFNIYVKNQGIVNNYDWVNYHPNAQLLTASLYWIILENRKNEIQPNITDLIHIIQSMINDYKIVFGTNSGIYLEFLEGSLLSLQHIKQSFLIIDGTMQ